MSRFELIGFDMDGVLVDSFDCWWKLLNDTLARRDKPTLSREEFAACWGQDMAADQRRFFPDWTVDQVVEHYTREFPRFAEWIVAEPEADDVLRDLRRNGTRLAVASNSPIEMVERLLEMVSLRGYFECTVGVDLVPRGKPEPDLIEHILQISGVTRERMCYVGDSEFDARASRAAGVFFVGYRRPGDSRIESLRDLLKPEFL